MRWLHVVLLLADAAFTVAEVVEIDDHTFWTQVKYDEEWVLDFYADWCGYCRQYAPKFEAAERILASSPHKVHFGKVNVETNPGLSARFFVSRLPTVVHIKNQQVRVLPAANVNNLVSLLENQEWRAIEPVNGLTSPYSVIGNAASYMGRFVKYLSGVSPITAIVIMLGLLALVVFVPMYFPAPPEGEETISANEAAGVSTAVAKEEEKDGASSRLRKPKEDPSNLKD